MAALVALVGLDAAVVDGELLEVGEDAKRQLGGPGVAAELEGGLDVVLDVDGRASWLRGRTCGCRRCGSSSRALWWRSPTLMASSWTTSL